MKQILLALNIEQSRAVADAVDIHYRLCMGRLDEVASLVRQGVIPVANPNMKTDRTEADGTACEQIDALMAEAKRTLGYPANGSHSIGHPDVCLSGRRSFEVHKVLTLALADHTRAVTAPAGVRREGCELRVTHDPAPVATVFEDGTHHE